ncbi:MAG TPA: GNAT family protein [Bacillota bacterium]|nr:GNAT family protein [Bacillota bacterium]
MMIMETERLTIRNFRPDDWQDLYEYLSQDEVLQYEPETANTEAQCRQKAEERSRGDEFLAVCLKTNEKMIGHLYFSQTEPHEFYTWELGYIFNPAYYGQGYATEACRRLIQYAFKELHAHRIIALCSPENTASWRLLERLSMRREGLFKKPAYFRTTHNGRPLWHDAYQYAILEEEWKENTI